MHCVKWPLNTPRHTPLTITDNSKQDFSRETSYILSIFGKQNNVACGKIINTPLKGCQTHKFSEVLSGVARAFPGGRLAHPEGQNEEENK